MKGQNLRVFIGDKCVAVSTNCTFHIAKALEDSTTHDSEGDWQQQQVVGRSWDVSVDTLFSFDADTDATKAITPSELLASMVTSETDEVTLKWAPTEGAKNRSIKSGIGTYSGKAILNDVSVQGPNRQNATSTFQFTGNGPLSVTD